MDKLRCGLIGYGYWGPNLARNLQQCRETQLVRIVDADPRRIQVAAERFPGATTDCDSHSITQCPAIDAVFIATPVSTHYELALDALQHGKHVFVEKPMAEVLWKAQHLAEEAERQGRLLMVDHTFMFTEPIRWMREFIRNGELGETFYFDSIRTNLGLYQRDVSVLWDLAPHDLSVLLDLIGRPVQSVTAVGACHAGSRVPDIAYVTLDFGDGCLAHVHVSWLSPVKVRRMLLAGSRRMIIFDDMETSEKLKIYDTGVSIAHEDVEGQHRMMVDYRTGEMRSPALPSREALTTEIHHFLACVRGEEKCISSAEAGVANVRILQAAQASMDSGGTPVCLDSLEGTPKIRSAL